MATFEDEVLREIAGCCICDESARSAAQKVAKLVEEKFTSTSRPSAPCSRCDGSGVITVGGFDGLDDIPCPMCTAYIG